jgi:hypothetical protein
MKLYFLEIFKWKDLVLTESIFIYRFLKIGHYLVYPGAKNVIRFVQQGIDNRPDLLSIPLLIFGEKKEVKNSYFNHFS